MFHLMCFIIKTEILYTRVQCKERGSGAVFLFPCCIAAGCSPENVTELANNTTSRKARHSTTVDDVYVDASGCCYCGNARVVSRITQSSAGNVESGS